MKRLFAALAAGLALGFAVLGLNLSPATSGITFRDQSTARPLSPAAAAPSQDGNVAGPASHRYAGLEPGLNQNLIDGLPTTVCTTDSTLFYVLETAIESWNSSLSNLTFGDDGSETPLVLYQGQGTTPGVPSNCDADEVDVVASQEKLCNNVGAVACYVPTPQSNPRRWLFETPLNTDRNRPLNSAHASMYFQTSNKFNVAVHELGHVLGLRDYRNTDGTAVDEGCTRLRDRPVEENHFSVMRNDQDAECWSEGVITGRDLHDLYEAYHVGAITNVQLALAKMRTSIGRNQPFVFEWRTSGVGEASHNASHIVVFGKNDDETAWRMVGHEPIRDSNGVVRTKIELTDRIYGSTESYSNGGGFADAYKVVGVTRGDIRRQGSFDETVLLVGNAAPGPSDSDPIGGPTQPTNVDASGSGTTITLSWDAVSGATGYMVRQGENGTATPATGYRVWRSSGQSATVASAS